MKKHLHIYPAIMTAMMVMLLPAIFISNQVFATETEKAAVTTFFYDFNDGEIPDDIIIIDANEGENNNGNQETGEVTWIIAENQGMDATPCLYNRTHPGPADDWIVTPLISITEGYVLSFFARCNASFPDSLEIYASTTGTEVEDFTILIEEGFRVAGTFTRYDFVISDHPELNPGDEVYLGIWNYTHGSRIYLDDLGYGEGDPGVMIRAYSTSEDGIDILFDGYVGGESLIAENFILQGTEDITFGSAVVNEDNDRLLHLGDASAPILPDLVVDSILNTETEEFVKFYAGLFPVAYANINNPDGALPGDYPASFQVLVMAKNGTNRAWLADGAGPRHGVNAYGSEFHDLVEVGDEVIVYGRVSPYLFQTEILAFHGKTISTDNALYAPYYIAGSEINTDIPPDTDPAEMYEGLLVEISMANITAYDAPYFIATDDNGAHSFRIGDGFNLFDGTFDENLLEIDLTYDITGFVVNRDGQYRIVPRNIGDISEVIINKMPEINTGDVVMYPNPVSDLLNIEAADLNAIRIFNPAALLVREVMIPPAQTRISMEGLKPGLYIVVVEFADGSSKSQTIIRL